MKKTTIKKMLALVVGVLIITASLTAGFSVFAATANAGPLNLDFSDGFNHWKGETSIYSVENGVLKTNASYEAGSWRWLKTEPFTIPNAVAGTVVELYLDIAFEDGLPSMNGNENQAGALESNPANKLVDTFFADPSISDSARYTECTEANGQRNQIFYNEEGTVLVGSQTIADPAQEFDFWVGCGNSAKKTWEITNIRLVVTHPNGTVEVYPEGAEAPTPPAEGGDDVEEPETPAVTFPAYYGTEENGFDSTGCSYPFYLKPADDLYNLDFTNGFVFWAGRKNGGTDVYAGDNMEIVTEANGNKYVKVPESGYVTSIRTCLFTAKNVAIGDKLVVIYDVKGEDVDTMRVQVLQEPMKAGIEYDATTGMSTTMKADGSGLLNPSPGMTAIMVGTGYSHNEFDVNLGAEGWTTYIGDTTSNVVDPANASSTATMDQTIYLQVALTCGDAGVEAGDKVDAAIDNIRIAKVVDGVYYNILDNSVIYDPNATDDPGTGDDDTPGTTPSTGDSVLALAALFFVSGAAVFGTAKAMKKR